MRQAKVQNQEAKSKHSETDCIFCKIVAGELPSKKVYEDDEVLVFEDVTPQAPVHVLVVPKRHIPTLNEIDDEGLVEKMVMVARKVAGDLAINEAYKLQINVGSGAGQIVFHLHWHLMGGWKKIKQSG